jgi:serine/threonine protein kinase
MDEHPLYSVVDFTFSDFDTESELAVMCNGKRFHITLSANNFEDSPFIKESYIHYLQVAEAFELDGLTVDDFYDWVLQPFLPIFENVPPLVEHHRPSLQEYLFPDTVEYTLRAVEGKLVPFPNSQGESGRLHYGVHLSQELCSPWPSFHPRQVQLCDDYPEGAISRAPSKVSVDGKTTCFFKPFHLGDTLSARDELTNYKTIGEAALDQTLRISRLYGLVRDESSGPVYGLLLSYIDCRNLTLGCAVKPNTPSNLRQQWASQITHTLKCLHKAGVVWGDAKPDNVLIDVNKDAWIVDFGGGCTEGWVEKEIAGTVQGDLQGLAKILEYLGIEA